MLSATAVLVAAAAPAFAQQTPFVAEIARETVNVRAQASGNHLVVGRLQRGDQVVVTKIVRDWARVRLPSHFRIWISAKYVKQSGTTGTITASRLNLRPSPGLEGTPVGLVNRGDRVRIYGKKDGFFEIAPPTSAYGWMFKSTLKFVKPGTSAAQRGNDLKGSGPDVVGSQSPKQPAAPVTQRTNWMGKAWDAFTASRKGEVGYRDFTSVRAFLNRAKAEGSSAQEIAVLERQLTAEEAADAKTRQIEKKHQEEIDQAKAEYDALVIKFRKVVDDMKKPKAPEPYTATGTFKALGMVWTSRA
ncbi:MAG: SH3 domain-containing protein [Planctomycetota bacterium]|jgi:uncharacterized protein YgiM (DUF1202 family)